MSDDWPIAGTLLAARYRLAELLETGGMAEIWRADDELLGRPVAVKLPTGAQVAWREARMAAKLSHPGIAAVHDYREAVRPDGTVAPFVVMELLAGETIAARLVREPIGTAEAARIGAAVADALAAAHASGVVHRDIKPGNVMLTPNGVKILDFGISAAAGEPDDDETGSTFGTPAYVAPERMDGMPAEPATDVYGLGVLLFEMVTGEPPYPVDTWEELAEARERGPNELPLTLPADFRALVARCLDDDPLKRPPADEVRFDLNAMWLKPDVAAAEPAAVKPDEGWHGPTAEHWYGPLAEPVMQTPLPAPAPVGTGRASPATVPLAPPPPRRRRAVSIAVALLVVAVGGIFALVNWPRKPSDSGRAQAAPSTASTRPAVPLATPSSAAPPTSAPASPSPSASPSPKPKPPPKLSFDDAVTRMQTAIDDGADRKEIRVDVVTDLNNLLRNVAEADSKADGRDVGRRLEEFRTKLRQRQVEGSVTSARATTLLSRLTDLDRAAGT